MRYHMDELWKPDAKWKKTVAKVTWSQSHCMSADRGKSTEVRVNPQLPTAEGEDSKC